MTSNNDIRQYIQYIVFYSNQTSAFREGSLHGTCVTGGIDDFEERKECDSCEGCAKHVCEAEEADFPSCVARWARVRMRCAGRRERASRGRCRQPWRGCWSTQAPC